MTQVEGASLPIPCEATMKTTDYIKQLARGTLRNTALAVLSSGSASHQDEFAQVCSLIDDGLMRLYSRYVIKEKHVIVEMQPGVTFYHLKSMYSLTGANPMLVPRPYIMDSVNEPFLDDVIRVLTVFDSAGNRRPLNDQSYANSIFTPQADVIQNMYPKDLEALGIAYQAKPVSVLVDSGGSWAEDTEFYLPDCLIPALSSYIAFLYLHGIGTAEAVTLAMTHNRIYEDVCAEVDRMDLVNQSLSCTNVRFSSNGWI